jgi:hypothetical protein
MRSLERFLIALDEGMWGAIYRVGLGLAMPPVFGVLSGGQASISGFVAFFLAVLIGLRVGPVVFRRALPFSAQAKDIWTRRRTLAKRYDSYQWQKLFWVGLRPGELLVTALCLIGGGAGQFVWRKARADFGAPVQRSS